MFSWFRKPWIQAAQPGIKRAITFREKSKEGSWIVAVGIAGVVGTAGVSFAIESAPSSDIATQFACGTSPERKRIWVGGRTHCNCSVRRKFGLIVTDLDGTLLNSQGRVSDKTKEALGKVISPECPIVLATARSQMEYTPWRELPGPLYSINFGGAQCSERRASKNADDGWELHELFLKVMTEAETRFGVAAADAEQSTVWLCQPDRVFIKLGVLGRRESVDVREYFNKQSGMEHSRFIEVEDLDGAIEENRTLELLVMNSDPEGLAERFKLAVEAAGCNLEVMHFAPEPMASLKAPGIDKESALRWLCQYLGKDANEVVAFGDGTNDIPMLSFAGFSVAMANAKPAVKSVADITSPFTNDEDAVAHEIEKMHENGNIQSGSGS